MHSVEQKKKKEKRQILKSEPKAVAENEESCEWERKKGEITELRRGEQGAFEWMRDAMIFKRIQRLWSEKIINIKHIKVHFLFDDGLYSLFPRPIFRDDWRALKQFFLKRNLMYVCDRVFGFNCLDKKQFLFKSLFFQLISSCCYVIQSIIEFS